MHGVREQFENWQHYIVLTILNIFKLLNTESPFVFDRPDSYLHGCPLGVYNAKSMYNKIYTNQTYFFREKTARHILCKH